MTSASHIPKGFHTINPYVIVPDADRLISFLKDVFEAEEIMRMAAPGRGIAHAEVRIGDSVLECSDASEQWKAMPASLHIYVPDIDCTYARAIASGAESLAEPTDQFYGERSASVRDTQGNVWHIATRTEDLSKEEMERRAAAMHQS